MKIQDYEVHETEVLGRGGFGVVYKAVNTKTNKTVAVKKCEKISSRGSAAMEEYKNLLHVSDHTNVVTLIDIQFEKNCFWIITEFCDLGDMECYMKQYRPALNDLVLIMVQCSHALAFLHSLSPKVVHRDIKPSNFLFKKENGIDILKIADFGISKIVASDPSVTVALATKAGTEIFMPPEMFQSEKYSEKVDIFSLGLVFHSILNFKPNDEHMYLITANPRKSRVRSFGKELYEADMRKTKLPQLCTIYNSDSDKKKCLKSLINSMVEFEPKKRLPADEVKRQLEEAVDGWHIPKDLSAALSGSSDEEILSNDLPKSRGGQPKGLHKYMTSSHHGTMRSTKYGKRLPGQSRRDHRLQKLQELLTPFTPGLVVTLLDDKEDVTKINSDAGYWTADDISIEKYLGQTGLVKSVNALAVNVIFADGEIIPLHPSCLTLGRTSLIVLTDVSAGHKFKWLDVVRKKVILTLEEVKQLQKNHGGWAPDIEMSMQVNGIVMCLHEGDKTILVEFIDGRRWILNTAILESVPAVDRRPSTGDKVVVVGDFSNREEGFPKSIAEFLGLQGTVFGLTVDGNNAQVHFLTSAKGTIPTKHLKIIEVAQTNSSCQ